MNATPCDFEEAAINHLRDALALTHEQRWQWLAQAMELGFETARQRAERGLTTLGTHGEVLWSPEMAREWAARPL